MTAETKQVQKFKSVVRKYYREHHRAMPWRKTRDPYKILVSEVMLQQTQVSRVREKYPSFIKRFPDVRTLAKAPFSAVLREWSGLGYNRRAKFLKQAARIIAVHHHGKVPDQFEDLVKLPGVGKSTAGGILAFAYNKPTIFIETNIRRVFIHHFFRGKKNIPDAKIIPLVAKTLDRANSREWYYALFDYGAHLAANMPNPNRRSRHYVRQPKFKGSLREARGKIVRALSRYKRTLPNLIRLSGLNRNVCKRALRVLIDEGLVAQRGEYYTIAE